VPKLEDSGTFWKYYFVLPRTTRQEGSKNSPTLALPSLFRQTIANE